MIESIIALWKHLHPINQTFFVSEVAVQRSGEQQQTPSLPG